MCVFAHERQQLLLTSVCVPLVKFALICKYEITLGSSENIIPKLPLLSCTHTFVYLMQPLSTTALLYIKDSGAERN